MDFFSMGATLATFVVEDLLLKIVYCKYLCFSNELQYMHVRWSVLLLFNPPIASCQEM